MSIAEIMLQEQRAEAAMQYALARDPEVAAERFLEDSGDLVLSPEDVIEEAYELLRDRGCENAEDIFARWDDMQEEMRVMMAEARAEFGF